VLVIERLACMAVLRCPFANPPPDQRVDHNGMIQKLNRSRTSTASLSSRCAMPVLFLFTLRSPAEATLNRCDKSVRNCTRLHRPNAGRKCLSPHRRTTLRRRVGPQCRTTLRRRYLRIRLPRKPMNLRRGASRHILFFNSMLGLSTSSVLVPSLCFDWFFDYEKPVVHGIHRRINSCTKSSRFPKDS
jgi:hypothetical protein